jgi:hypothetical protein
MNGALQSRLLKTGIFKLFYLAVIAIAMIGWSWVVFQGLAWALDI